MRRVLCVCAAVALCLAPLVAPARAPGLPALTAQHIKRQILAKLGLSSRPTPQRAPPRDVVRQILAHAADPAPPPHHEGATREIIAIAQRGDSKSSNRRRFEDVFTNQSHQRSVVLKMADTAPPSASEGKQKNTMMHFLTAK